MENWQLIVGLKFLFLFCIGSVSGWLIELFYRRFFTPAKKWINPGFLNGPCLPLYGFGVCGLYIISDLSISFWLKLVLFCGVMTAVEYGAGIIFIKGMKIKLWDYSDRWGNIQGIICPLFSFFWLLMGVFFYFLIYPLLIQAINWLSNNLVCFFVIGMFYGILCIDIGISFKLSTKIRKIVLETKQVIAYEKLKLQINMDQKALKKRSSFLFPFKSDNSLRRSIENTLKSVYDKLHWDEK